MLLVTQTRSQSFSQSVAFMCVNTNSAKWDIKAGWPPSNRCPENMFIKKKTQNMA